MKKGNVKRRILISYWLIVLIPIVLMLLFMLYVVLRMGDESREKQEMRLSQLQNTLDNAFAEKWMLLSNLVNEPETTRFLEKGETEAYTPQELLTMAAYQKEIRGLTALSRGGATDMGVIDPDHQTMISGYTLSRGEAMQIAFSEMGTSEAELEALAENSPLQFILLSEEADQVYLIQKLFTKDYQRYSGFAYLAASKSELIGLMQLFGEDGCAFISCGDSLIVSDETFRESLLAYVREKEPGDAGKIRLKNTRYYVHITESGSTSLRFGLVEAVAGAMLPSYYVIFAFILMLVLTVVSSAFAIRMIGSRDIHPLYSILRVLFPQKEATEGVTTAELIAETKNVKKNVEDMNMLWEESFSRLFLTGQDSGTAIEKRLLDEYRATHICVIGIMNVEFSERGTITDYAIGNVLHELLEQEAIGQPALIDRSVYLLAAVSADGKAGSLREKTDGILRVLHEILDVVLIAAISDAVQGLHSVGKAKEQVDSLVKTAFVVGDYGRVFMAEDMGDWMNEEMDSEYLQESRQFTNCVLVKDYKGAKAHFELIWKRHIRREMHSSKADLLKLRHLLYTLAIPAKLPSPSEEALEPGGSLEGLYDRGIRILDSLLEGEGGEDNNSRMEEIKAYICKNAFDPNLSIYEVSAHFHMSQSSLTRLFKRYEHIGPLDYLHKFRLAEAKKLLERGMGVGETARQVGYIEAKALSRVFKRYEGITPGQYKNLNRKDG